LQCEEVSYSEYIEIIKHNDKDPYFLCKSKQEQKQLLPELNYQLFKEDDKVIKYKKINSIKRIKYFEFLNKQMNKWIESGLFEWIEQKNNIDIIAN
jgi:hypothetical protein